MLLDAFGQVWKNLWGTLWDTDRLENLNKLDTIPLLGHPFYIGVDIPCTLKKLIEDRNVVQSKSKILEIGYS
ncbi:MAG: hypothetical protein DCF15_00875 [Phormidesmis priestleyi]|uniref:Uncharacterized protein n=1 Tax=Phormidesmis priestleyi TaxID=268141 RepID=A0A2W4ZR89_9CYAN|nr:MAG: hypothetical protein DCF15_00875 [Phormidesmis priestleyi]